MQALLFEVETGTIDVVPDGQGAELDAFISIYYLLPLHG
jgi:hypothetical protein